MNVAPLLAGTGCANPLGCIPPPPCSWSTTTAPRPRRSSSVPSAMPLPIVTHAQPDLGGNATTEQLTARVLQEIGAAALHHARQGIGTQE